MAEPKRHQQRRRGAEQRIQAAFLELVEQHGFEAVTVQAIVTHAGINRSTFYRHYEDIFDLAHCYLRELFDTFMQSLPLPVEVRTIYNTAQTTPPVGLVQLLEHIASHARFYRIMLGKGGSSAFSSYLRDYFARIIRQRIEALTQPTSPPQMPLDLMVQFYASAYLGSIVWWLEQHMPYTPEQLARWAMELLILGPHTLLGIQRD